MPGTYNLSFVAGDTVAFAVVLQNQDDEGNLTPMDLTGYTAKSQIRASASDPTDPHWVQITTL